MNWLATPISSLWDFYPLRSGERTPITYKRNEFCAIFYIIAFLKPAWRIMSPSRQGLVVYYSQNIFWGDAPPRFRFDAPLSCRVGSGKLLFFWCWKLLRIFKKSRFVLPRWQKNARWGTKICKKQAFCKLLEINLLQKRVFSRKIRALSLSDKSIAFIR